MAGNYSPWEQDAWAEGGVNPTPIGGGSMGGSGANPNMPGSYANGGTPLAGGHGINVGSSGGSGSGSLQASASDPSMWTAGGGFVPFANYLNATQQGTGGAKDPSMASGESPYAQGLADATGVARPPAAQATNPISGAQIMGQVATAQGKNQVLGSAFAAWLNQNPGGH